MCAAMDACFRRFLVGDKILYGTFYCIFLYSLRSDVYSISCDFFVTEVPERTRRTLDERSNLALKLSIAIVLGVRCKLNSIQYFYISTFVCR